MVSVGQRSGVLFQTDSACILPTVTQSNPKEESTMTEGSAHVQISARIPADLAAALEQSAAQADRTLSAELRRALKRYLTISVPERELGGAA